MGNCFSEPPKRQSRKVTLTIFGLDNAGKTSVVKVLQGGSRADVAPTVGFSTNQLKWRKTPVTVLDVGGGARIRDIWRNYFAESHGLVYVVDASDRERIAEAGEAFSKVLADQRMQGKPVLLLLNKQDLLGAINDTQAAEQMQLEPLVNTNKCPCRVEAISATHGTGKRMDAALKEGFNWLIRYIDDHYQELADKVSRDLEMQRAQLAKEKEERMERIRKAKEEREARGEVSEGEELQEKRPKGEADSEPAIQTAKPQNGHVTSTHGLITGDPISEPISQLSLPANVSNGHLPPLSHDFGNRSKRRVRPSSAGQEPATLTSSFQTSVIPHLPPIISPPQLKRPAPKLPTSHEIPPPATPPPTASGPRVNARASTDMSVSHKPPPWTPPSFPQPPTFADVGAMDESNQQRVTSGDSKEASKQAARRKRRKRRLQRFSRTAPTTDTALQQATEAKRPIEDVTAPPPTPIIPILKPSRRRPRIPSVDYTISNASSLQTAEAVTDKVPNQPQLISNSSPAAPKDELVPKL